MNADTINQILSFTKNRHAFAACRAACTLFQRNLDSPAHSELRRKLMGGDGNEWNLFALTSGRGYLLAAQWLARAFGLTASGARERCTRALQEACAGGHLEVVQWLAAAFALTADEVRAGQNCALRRACAGRHLVMTQWLVIVFKLGDKDVAEVGKYYSMKWTAGNPAAKWLNARSTGG